LLCKLHLFVGPPGSPDRGMMHASKGPPLPPPPPVNLWIHDVGLLLLYRHLLYCYTLFSTHALVFLFMCTIILCAFIVILQC